MRIIVDGVAVAAKPGERVLVALLRAGRHPTGGGCLCLAGDCPHCLAAVDGIAYVRTCQIPARCGMTIERQHLAGASPPLPPAPAGDAGPRDVPARHVHCDVVVIGLGKAGREAAEVARNAGKDVVDLDAGDGHEVVGIYAGPLVVARSHAGTLCLYPKEEIVVATGAAEIQPVAPGAELAGLVTARAAERLTAAGIDLGRVVAVGEPPEGVEAEPVSGEVIRFEGTESIDAVVLREGDGSERRVPCDTVSLGLGRHPRDALVRMGRDLGVRAVGDVARPSDIPPCPRSGIVCPCSGVTVDDLDQVWENGFRELELVKRASLAGTGTCQGAACLPHMRSFLADRGATLQAPFTARPMTRQLTMGEIAAGAYHLATPRTALHEEHLRLGAHMDRAGGWWRPWTYGDQAAEYWAVRGGVSICDVSTLGILEVSGPDSLALLEGLYPTQVASIRPGRSRYVLLLDERGYVLDDGLICRHSETRFTLTLTSAGSTVGELWIRDWAEAWGLDVRLLNQTWSLGAINVTGPRAAELLARAGALRLPGFACHRQGTVAGIACRIHRLSFTGELSFELHHASADSVPLWQRLLTVGEDLGVRPHGLETLLALRLEKGHIVVGKDTDFDATPRRLAHGWAVKRDKPSFVGRQALIRTDKVPLDRQLVGLEMPLPAPIEGAVVWHDGDHAGYVTSSCASLTLGKAVMLAWLSLVDGELPDEVCIEDRRARRVPTPFYDPKGSRARATVDLPATDVVPYVGEQARPTRPAGARRFRTLAWTRVAARPEAIDRASWPQGVLVLRLAADEVLVGTDAALKIARDPHAIIEPETGFAGAWLKSDEANDFLSRACAWELPDERPAFAQGAVAQIPVKLWLENDRVLFIVPSPFAADLEERMA